MHLNVFYPFGLFNCIHLKDSAIRNMIFFIEIIKFIFLNVVKKFNSLYLTVFD